MKRDPSLFAALVPVFLLIALLTANVFIFDDTLAGANQVALLLSASVGALVVRYYGGGWDKILKKVVDTISSAMLSLLILLFIGSLAGTWLISGVVPAMIYYGMDLVSPKVFLFTAVLVSAVVSLVTGSSWSTVATIGIALLGIGRAIGLNEAVVAGAIISGAYFGDKMSPLSDTTNLAPAMAGTDLFTHIRYMVYTTTPALILTLIIFLIIGFNHSFEASVGGVAEVKQAIDEVFFVSPVLMLVPVFLVTIIVLKVPALPALMAGSLAGGLCAVIFQPDIVRELAGNHASWMKNSYIAFMQAMFGDVVLETTHSSVNDLLSTSGMRGMLDTIWLILSAMIFGGVMESGGLLRRITRPVIQRVQSTGGLVAATAGTCIFFNVTASDQYISIVVPGRMFRKSYQEKGLKPEVLSRTLEDTGTMTSVLVPWNTCGATQSKVLGVATTDYLPYCFFNLLSPLMSVLYAYLNIKIRRGKI